MISWKLTSNPDMINKIVDGMTTTYQKEYPSIEYVEGKPVDIIKKTEGWIEYEKFLLGGGVAEPYQTDSEKLAFDTLEARIARSKAYNEAGLTWAYWNEINIEEDQEKIDKFRSDRESIRQSISIPE